MRALLLLLACLMPLASCAPKNEQAAEFPCGAKRCRTDQQYCNVTHAGSDGAATYTCESLPRPDCAKLPKDCRCTGSVDAGLILEEFNP